ncbi:MAG: YdiY family protein [Myxococcota bacterium]
MLLALASLAAAADPSFAGADAAGQKFEKPESHLAAELGGAFTSGNTQTYTLNASIDGDHRWKRNKLGVDAGANLGRSILDTSGDGHIDDTERALGWAETARKVWLDARYDRYVGARDSLYLLGGTLIDPFAGYDNRSHVQVGYSRILVETKRTVLVTEIGVDGAREDFVAGIEPNEQYLVAARVMAGLTHQFNDNVAFSDKVEVYENVPAFADVRVLNQASLTSKLSDKFSLKLSHHLTFDNQPVEGFQPLDQTATVTFVASIL